MTPRSLLLLPLFVVAALAQQPATPPAPAAPPTPSTPATAAAPAAPAVAAAPAGPSAAQIRLEKSPRHHEWVKVKQGDRSVTAFVAYPEVKDKALTVLVIHENRGLNDWARAIADRLAENGYIAIAPDLLSGSAPGGGDTKDFAAQGDATRAIGQLPPAQVAADLSAVVDYAKALPAANGKFAVVGFCWGGGQSWRVALARPDLALANVFYGSPPADADYAKITAPVLGYYGGNDARINATIEKSTAGMTAAGKTFEPVIYDGAGHAFMRSGEEPAGGDANKAAATASWTRLLAALAKVK
jgi:carboxymethylenebutenolidase